MEVTPSAEFVLPILHLSGAFVQLPATVMQHLSGRCDCHDGLEVHPFGYTCTASAPALTAKYDAC